MPFSRVFIQVGGTLTTIYTAATAEENIFSLLLNCDVDSNVYLYRLNGTTSTLLAFVRLFAGVPQKQPHKIIMNAAESLQAKAMDRVSADWQTLPDWQTNPNWHNPEESLPLELNVNIDISILTK
ncbi:hypothetical protein [Allocoleopsis sp.]|uniref:hypothetical protein n=1 Tax=Allocoleopsis sp. TaxID=3088169 RepID=UPI002FCF6929